MKSKISVTGALTAGVLTAVGASVCCVVPLLLGKLDLARPWIARLTALAPMRPFWLAATAVFFGVAFWLLYWQPAVGERVHANRAVTRRQRTVFWALSVIVLLLVAFPWYSSMLL